jgi:hypothetical protein
MGSHVEGNSAKVTKKKKKKKEAYEKFEFPSEEK